VESFYSGCKSDARERCKLLMSVGIVDIFWIFMMFSMLQPLLGQKLLDSSRIRLMRRIEKQRGSRLVQGRR
jgi:hypothetical protein